MVEGEEEAGGLRRDTEGEEEEEEEEEELRDWAGGLPANVRARVARKLRERHRRWPLGLALTCRAWRAAWEAEAGGGPPVSAVACAAEGGPATLRWARQQAGLPWDARVASACAEAGALEALRWARSQMPPCPWDSGLCEVAAEAGHEHVLRWARANGCPWDGNVFTF